MKHYDVTVIGSGPAGSTAAIYAVRNGFGAVIFTGSDIGGQLTITTEVENFPGFPKPIKGFDLVNGMLKQAENLGVKIIYSSIWKIDFSNKPFVYETENGESYRTSNVVIATGARARWLGLESEKKFLGHGVSGCATCDGNFFKNVPVAVIGGGDTAGTEALHMSRIASKVYLIYRQSSFIRMQDTISREVLANERIEVIFNSEMIEVCGKDEPKEVEYIKIINNKTQATTEINVKAVFIAIGRDPNNSIFINSGLAINNNGYIITEKDSARTNIKNVYAAGDITDKKFKQAILAAGYGCIAGLEIEEDNKDLATNGYRKAIGAIILDSDNNILAFRRSDFKDKYQGPEGGIDGDEEPIDALYRELWEEIGLARDEYEILRESKNFISYRAPNILNYKGQQKKFFLVKLKNKNPKFKYDNTEHAEFLDYRIVKADEFLELISSFKKELYRIVLKEFELS
jgi:thioredoxin reductase (NADPH)